MLQARRNLSERSNVGCSKRVDALRCRNGLNWRAAAGSRRNVLAGCVPRSGAERLSPLATRKELEAEGTAGMDDRRNDGRGAWMASEGAGHGSGPMPTTLEAQANIIEAVRLESPEIERCP